MSEFQERVTWCISALDMARGKRDYVKDELKKKKQERDQLRKEVRRSEKAQAILQHVANETQRVLQYHIEGTVDLAMEAIFPNPYKLKMEFTGGGKGEVKCTMMFERDGSVVPPLASCGGGVIDVAGFALRLALWSMARPRTRPVLVLDEPFKFLSKDLQSKSVEMLQEVSKRLQLQIIMVSHDVEAMMGADKLFVVEQRRGISNLKA